MLQSAHAQASSNVKGRPVTQRFLLGAAFYLLWAGLSGHFSAFLLVTSVLSVAGVLALLSHLGLISRDYQPFALLLAFIRYWGWLLVEILKANWDVIKAILSGRISPSMAWVPSNQKSEVCRALYANSITLTPGTVTVVAEGDHFLVHALKREGIDGLLTGDMDRRCAVLDARFRGETA